MIELLPESLVGLSASVLDWALGVGAGERRTPCGANRMRGAAVGTLSPESGGRRLT